MNIRACILILFTGIISNGCGVYPCYYSTGILSGNVIDQDTLQPVTNALVFSEFYIDNHDPFHGTARKRIATGYGITDAEGHYNVPSMSTIYWRVRWLFKDRFAWAHVTKVAHPEYTIVRCPNGPTNLHTWYMKKEKNLNGLGQIDEYFSGRGRVVVSRNDKMAVGMILEELRRNHPRADDQPDARQKRLYKGLLQQGGPGYPPQGVGSPDP